MADIDSSLDEILEELGDGFDADINDSNRKIVRSTSNKLWLILRAFSRGLYGLYQVVASLKNRFDPLYCTDDELESTMRIVGTSLQSGKASLLTVVIWNNHATESRTLPVGSYSYISSNGITFSLELYEEIEIPAESFMLRDFASTLGGEPYIGSFSVSENTGISVTESTGAEVSDDISFDCQENSSQLGSDAETLYEARQRILTDNQRQEILHILEERIQSLANVHECTIISNTGLTAISSSYMQDDGVTPVSILPQSVLVILTGSPTSDLALEFLSLSPFITTIPEGVADYGTVYYESDIYLNGKFPLYYLKHKVAEYNVVIKYGYSTTQTSLTDAESAMTDLLLSLKASTSYTELISAEDITDLLSEYQEPSIKILSIDFTYEGSSVKYIKFNKTQIARLGNISYQRVDLWD